MDSQVCEIGKKIFRWKASNFYTLTNWQFIWASGFDVYIWLLSAWKKWLGNLYSMVFGPRRAKVVWRRSFPGHVLTSSIWTKQVWSQEEGTDLFLVLQTRKMVALGTRVKSSHRGGSLIFIWDPSLWECVLWCGLASPQCIVCWYIYWVICCQNLLSVSLCTIVGTN